jgi:hypothetical protein
MFKFRSYSISYYIINVETSRICYRKRRVIVKVICIASCRLFTKNGDFTRFTSVVIFHIGRDRYLPVYPGSYVTHILYADRPTSSACRLLTRDHGDGRPAVDRFVPRARVLHRMMDQDGLPGCPGESLTEKYARPKWYI